ncbi:MAG: cupin domain-containing protein [Nocardioides sp.]
MVTSGGGADERLRDQGREAPGEFTWHSHADTDELFLVLEGELCIQLRDGDVTVHPGELYVVPKGVPHCPRAEGEVQAMLIEPRGVINTGDAPVG